jgi:hypothetical protein
MLGLVHVAIADACGSFPDAGYKWFKKAAKVKPGDSKKAAIGGAAYSVLAHVYPRDPQNDLITKGRNRFLQELARDPDGDVEAGWSAGSTVGADVAKQYWNQDKIMEATGPNAYVPRPGEHNIDPENPAQRYYGVLWGRSSDKERLVLPLALTKQEELDAEAPAPPLLDQPKYAADWNEVKASGAREVVTGTESEEIALFWAYDGAREIGTPPRLYNQHVRQIALEHDGIHPSEESELARLLALCNLALADGGIVCWTGKYQRRVWRPIRAIRNVDKIKLPSSLPSDADWKPFGSPRTNTPPSDAPEIVQTTILGASGMAPQFTPNFPAYPSGHATLGAAAFTVLRLFRAEKGYGNEGSVPGNRLDVRLPSDELNPRARDHRTGEPRPLRHRRFTRIKRTTSEARAMIEENSTSRIFQGVHWRFDATEGIRAGEKIGEFVFNRVYRRLDKR